ncbi:MAG: tRNA pseudouridine(55) synthase TruB [Myxococcales bacterium]|nr:tRNA pseudouridine(55) synthase TruB [Myxococcales bacterium]
MGEPREGGGLHGVLLVDKPEGPTSHDVVGWVRRLVRSRRVGHCGTLDPAASGLLVVTVGLATRIVPFLTEVDKAYRAEVVLGRRTASGDRDGEILADVPVDPAIAPQAIAAAEGLVGDHSLPPPAYSAVRIDGERAYARVRRGEQVELPPRLMRVLAVDEVSAAVREPDKVVVTLTLRVSKGTYIRSLAELLGARLGLPAYLGGLRRIAAGDLRVDAPGVLRPRAHHDPTSGRWRFSLADASEPEALPEGALRPIDEVLGLPSQALDLGSPALVRLGQGQALTAAELGFADPSPGDLVSLVARGAQGSLDTVIIGRVEGRGGDLVVRPQRVLRLDNSPRDA